MAAPFYGTDLTTLSTAESTTGWTEPAGATVGAITAETDYFIQGTGCIAKNQQSAGSTGAGFTASAITLPASGAVMIWYWYGAPNALDIESRGGCRGVLGTDLSNYKIYYLFGSDTYAFGGWRCIPMDPSQTADFTSGTFTQLRYFGGIAQTSGANIPTKGNVFGQDAVRWGRVIAQMSGGDAGSGYCTLSGFSAVDNTVANRWGQIQPIEGGYKVQGLVAFGTGNLVDFRDSNTSVVIADTKKVNPGFNGFEVKHSGSRVDLTAVTITSLGTNSRGYWSNIDNATVNLINCTFTDMSTFKFQSGTTATNTVFRRTGTVTQSGSTITNCTFDSCRDAVTLIADTPNIITNCAFTSDGNNHAMQIVTAGSCTFAGHSFTGYVTGTGSSDTGNEVVYNTSGGSVTISVTSGQAPSIRNSGSSTTTVITGQKTLTMTGIVTGSVVKIYESGTMAELASTGSSLTSFQYTYTYVSDVSASIVVFNLDYNEERFYYVLGNADSTLPIRQIRDRQYFNPA